MNSEDQESDSSVDIEGVGGSGNFSRDNPEDNPEDSGSESEDNEEEEEENEDDSSSEDEDEEDEDEEEEADTTNPDLSQSNLEQKNESDNDGVVSVGDDDNDDDEDDEDEDDYSQDQHRVILSKEMKTHQLLVERCDAIKQDNYRLVSRIQEVRTLCQKGLRDRKLLISRLDSFGDDFRNVPIVMPPDEGVLYTRRRRRGGNKNNLETSANSASLRTTSNEPRKRKSTGNPVGRPKKAREGQDEVNKVNRRPKNPFYYFCQKERQNSHREYRHKFKMTPSRKEITKVLSQKWREMGDNDKQIYTDQFEKEKQKHLAQKLLQESTTGHSSSDMGQ